MESKNLSDDPGCHFECSRDALGVDTRGVRSFLDRLAHEQAPSQEFSVAVTDDENVRAANCRYRQTDRITDVLAFPDGEHGNLGDIMIAAGRAAEQAAERSHPVETEVQILALHGLLHLKGFDHACDNGEMRREEERLRKKYGLPTGLIARASAIQDGSGTLAPRSSARGPVDSPQAGRRMLEGDSKSHFADPISEHGHCVQSPSIKPR